MERTYPHNEFLGKSELRRRWMSAEQLSKVKETDETSATFSLVSLCHCIASNRLFGGRKLAAQEALTASSE